MTELIKRRDKQNSTIKLMLRKVESPVLINSLIEVIMMPGEASMYATMPMDIAMLRATSALLVLGQ